MSTHLQDEWPTSLLRNLSRTELSEFISAHEVGSDLNITGKRELASRVLTERNGQSSNSGDFSWETVKAQYEDDKRAARLKAALLAISQLNFVTLRRSEKMYVYDNEEKIYDEQGVQALKELLVRKLGPYHSKHEVSEIRAKVKALTYHPQFGADPVIPLANGDLSLSPLELLDATPKRPFLVRSPARWDPKAESPIFDKYLRKAVPSERHRLTLQEYIGYCLLHWDIPLHKALFIVGPTASGKSTLLKIVCKLLAKIATVAPQGLVDNRFKSSELEGAWANIRSDISSELMKNIGLFKELTAGDQIYVEEKHQQGYMMEPTAKHIYSANQLPSISTDDDAFYRRILLVPFPTTVPVDKRDPKLPQRLEKELDGILQWAVEGLLRLREQEGFTCDPGPKETRRKWEEHGSSIGQFKAAKLRVTGDSEDVEPKQRVHSAYTAFCKENGLSAETQDQLTRSLKSDPQITDGKRTPEEGGSQVRSFVGVQIE